MGHGQAPLTSPLRAALDCFFGVLCAEAVIAPLSGHTAMIADRRSDFLALISLNYSRYDKTPVVRLEWLRPGVVNDAQGRTSDLGDDR